MTNHDDFATLDLGILSTVNGGQNSDDVNIGASGTAGGGRVRIGIQGTRTRTNWAHCADTVRGMGGTPRDVRDTCGLPPA